MKLSGIACVATLVGALASAAPTLAAPANSGARSRSSSIRLVVINDATSAVAAASTAVPRFGDQVTFDVATGETAFPYVDLKCVQNGALVGEAWEGFFDGALGDRTFTLSSPQWTGGAADCTASLDAYVNGRWKPLASTSFHVNA